MIGWELRSSSLSPTHRVEARIVYISSNLEQLQLTMSRKEHLQLTRSERKTCKGNCKSSCKVANVIAKWMQAESRLPVHVNTTIDTATAHQVHIRFTKA